MSSQVTLCFKSGKMDQVLSVSRTISEISDSAGVTLITGTLWADFCSSWGCGCSEMRWADYNSTGSTVFMIPPSTAFAVLMENVGYFVFRGSPEGKKNNKGNVNAVWGEIIPGYKGVQPPLPGSNLSAMLKYIQVVKNTTSLANQSACFH